MLLIAPSFYFWSTLQHETEHDACSSGSRESMEESIELKSEVAQLKKQIEREYESARQGLVGFASVARHTFINAKMERVASYHEQLKKCVGEAEAVKILYEIVEQSKEEIEAASQPEGKRV